MILFFVVISVSFHFCKDKYKYNILNICKKVVFGKNENNHLVLLFYHRENMTEQIEDKQLLAKNITNPEQHPRKCT